MPAKDLTIVQDDIWRRGVPLEEAVWAYATDEEVKVLAKPQGSLFLNKIMLSIGQAAVRVGKAASPELQNQPSQLESERVTRETQQAIKNRKAVTEKIVDRLIAELWEGRFELYGYAVPRMPKDRLVKIPADLYDWRYINWDGSTVKGNGLEFIAAIIMEAPNIEIKPDHRLPPSIEHQIGGPISAKSAIAETIEYMTENGLLPDHQMQKQLIPSIRRHIHERYPGQFPHDRGLSSESIRMVLAEKRINRQINSRD